MPEQGEQTTPTSVANITEILKKGAEGKGASKLDALKVAINLATQHADPKKENIQDD